MKNLEQTAETYFLAFDHISWNDLRGIFGATSFDSDEKVREEFNSSLKIKVTGAQKNNIIYLITGDTVLECSSPVAHPSRQGLIFNIRHCFRLSHDIFELMSSSGQLIKKHWEIIIPGYDHQSLEDYQDLDLNDGVQFELPKSEYSEFLSMMTESNPETEAGAKADRRAGSNTASVSTAQQAATNANAAEYYLPQPIKKEELDQQIALLKSKYSLLNWDSAALADIAVALAKWSFSAKDERRQFMACVMSGSVIKALKDYLSQMDPPVHVGGETELSELSQQLIQVWQQLSYNHDLITSLTKEIETAEQQLSLLDQYSKLKSEENVLVQELERLKKLRTPIIRFNVRLFFNNVKLSKAMSRAAKCENTLLKSQLKQAQQLMQTQSGPGGSGAAFFANTRPSVAERRYEKNLKHLSDMLDKFSAKYNGLVADQRKVAVQYKLNGVQAEIASISGQLRKFSQAVNSSGDRSDLAKKLRKDIVAYRFCIALLQGIHNTMNAPIPSIALEFLDKPALFILDSQNSGSCELLAALSPKVVLIDETVNPNLWLQSSGLLLQWINNKLTPLGGTKVPGIEKTLEQLRNLVKNNDIREETILTAFPGITPAMAGYFIRNLSQ